MKTPIANQTYVLPINFGLALLFISGFFFSACQQTIEPVVETQLQQQECKIIANSDRFIVEAPSGLRIRSSPELEAPILGKIPDGGKVIVQQVVAYYADEIEGANNHWVHLRYEQQDSTLEGYSFGGYLRRAPLDLEFLLPDYTTYPKEPSRQQIRMESRRCAYTGTLTRWMFVHNGLDYVNGIQLPDSVSIVPMQNVLPPEHRLFSLQTATNQIAALIIIYPNNEIQQFVGGRFYINDYDRIPLIAAVRDDLPASITKIDVFTRKVEFEIGAESHNKVGDKYWTLIMEDPQAAASL